MNNPISGFVIVVVYVDDLNIIGIQREMKRASDYLKGEFEMKDLGHTKYCLSLQIEHSEKGIFVYQPSYTKSVLK